MDVLVTLALLALLLAAPCFVQLVLWSAYAALRAVTRVVDGRLLTGGALPSARSSVP